MIVSGIGTDVGKTVVSAVLTTMLNGDYWKPVECGPENIASLIDTEKHFIHPPAYKLPFMISPHLAPLDPKRIILPKTRRPLIIESCGGVLVPLTSTFTTLDLFQTWNLPWIVVSRHYLGSINHTLLTLEELKRRKVPILGLIFNGEVDPAREEPILKLSGVPFLERLLPETNLTPNIIQRYAKKWSGTLLPR